MRRVFEFPAFFRVPRNQGFTLIEMIIVIMVTGIALAMLGVFGRGQIEAYLASSNRAELADAADTALLRFGRDVQRALPNSVRPNGVGLSVLEYVPIKDAGRYRADVNSSGGGDWLDFGSTTDNSFEVLGPPVTVGSGDQLVIYNLGVPGSDVYEGSNRRSISSAAGAQSSLQFTLGSSPNQQFPLASPGNRFHVVGGPVSYECAADAVTPAQGVIRRHTCYAFRPAQPAAGTFSSLTPYAGCTAVQSAVLVNNVAACNFSYQQGTGQRDAIVSLYLKLTRNGESVELLHQVEVLNTP